MANSKTYHVKAESEVEIHNEDHGKILMKNLKQKGVVVLHYDETAQLKYPTFEAFKDAMRVQGLEALAKFKKEHLLNERMASVDRTNDKSGETLRTLINPDKFEEEVKAVEEKLNEAKKQQRGLKSVDSIEPGKPANKNTSQAR